MGLGSSGILRKCSYIGREEGSSGGGWGRGARVWSQQSPAGAGKHQPDPVGILGNGLSPLAVPICGSGAGLFILLYFNHWIRADWGGKGECKFPGSYSSPPSWAKGSPVAWGQCSEAELQNVCVKSRSVDICICVSDSLCCTADTSNIVNKLYPNKSYFKKRIEGWGYTLLIYTSNTLVSDEKICENAWKPQCSFPQANDGFYIQ